MLKRVCGPLLGGLLCAAILAWPAASQTKDGTVISCLYDGDQTPEVYRIRPGSWQVWNARAWAWEERTCVTNSGPGTCTATVSDSAYRWDLKFSDHSSAAYYHDYVGALVIDRRTSAATFVWKEYHFYYPKPVETSERRAKGACQKAADPARQPRPEPKL